jgi:hypothetical protein
MVLVGVGVQGSRRCRRAIHEGRVFQAGRLQAPARGPDFCAASDNCPTFVLRTASVQLKLDGFPINLGGFETDHLGLSTRLSDGLPSN